MYSKIILIFSITELIEFYLKFIESLFNDFCRKFGKLILSKFYLIKILFQKILFTSVLWRYRLMEPQLKFTLECM